MLLRVFLKPLYCPFFIHEMGMMLPSPTYILHKAYMFMDTLKSRNRDNTVFFCRLMMSLTTIHVFARVSRRGGHAVGSIAEFFGKQEE